MRLSHYNISLRKSNFYEASVGADLKLTASWNFRRACAQHAAFCPVWRGKRSLLDRAIDVQRIEAGIGVSL